MAILAVPWGAVDDVTNDIRDASADTVVVSDGLIAAVGPTKKTKVPPGAEVVDLAGKQLIPGIVDMHGHVDNFRRVLALADKRYTWGEHGLAGKATP